MCKYLERLGFNVFEFGVHPDGKVDVSNGDGEDVVVGVTKEQQEQISAYMNRLLERVEDFIETYYEDKHE